MKAVQTNNALLWWTWCQIPQNTRSCLIVCYPVSVEPPLNTCCLSFPGQHEQRQQFIFPEASSRKDVRSWPEEIFLKPAAENWAEHSCHNKTKHCLIWGFNSWHLIFFFFYTSLLQAFFLNLPSCEIKPLVNLFQSVIRFCFINTMFGWTACRWQRACDSY